MTPTDIADELWRVKKIRVDRRKIGTDALKRIGRYDIPIELFAGVTVEVKTMVVPEGGDLPSEDELAAMEATERAEQEAAAPEEPEVDLEEVIAADDEATEAAEAAAGERQRRRPRPTPSGRRRTLARRPTIQPCSTQASSTGLSTGWGVLKESSALSSAFGRVHSGRSGDNVRRAVDILRTYVLFSLQIEPFPPMVKTELSTR